MQKMYEDSGRFAVTVTGDVPHFNPSDFAKYDAIVCNYTGYPKVTGQRWPAATEKAFIDYIAAGHGFVLFHAARLPACLPPACRPAGEPKPLVAGIKPEILKFDPFTWPDQIPGGCPFEHSMAFNAIRFIGVKSGFRYGDTWYPSWDENDILYFPWTDGKPKRLDGYTDWSQSWVHPECHAATRRPCFCCLVAACTAGLSPLFSTAWPCHQYAGLRRLHSSACFKSDRLIEVTRIAAGDRSGFSPGKDKCPSIPSF